MKYIRIVLSLSLFCFINQLPIKAADKKNDSNEQMSLSTRAGHAGAGVIKTGVSLAQLAAATFSTLVVAGAAIILISEKKIDREDKAFYSTAIPAMLIITPTLFKGSWNNGKSAVQSFMKIFGGTKKSETEAEPDQLSKSSIPRRTSKVLLKAGLAIAQLVLVPISAYRILKLAERLGDPKKSKFDCGVGIGFWSTVGLTALHAAFNNSKPAIQSFTEDANSKKEYK